MNGTKWLRGLILLAVLGGVISTTIVFAILHHDDGDRRVSFELTDHNGQQVTENNLAGKHLLVFFGFTSCTTVCPARMYTLSEVTRSLYDLGYEGSFLPVFISVDPERDSVEQVSHYLESFHEDFVGLTGSRTALNFAAARFKTKLQKAPVSATPGYQLRHGSVIYIVDPLGSVIDFIPYAKTHAEIVAHVQTIFSPNQLRVPIR